MSYQNILLVIQGLPRQWETVDRFSGIIGAPFRGDARCPGVIVDAFNDFWGSAYADVNEPKAGWSAPIKAALQASRQGDETHSANLDQETLEPAENDHDDQGSKRENISESSGEILSTGDIGSDIVPNTTVIDNSIQPHPRDTTTVSKSPSTPRKERRTHVSTPPRRHRTSSSPKTLHTLGSEPRSPLTDLRKRNASSASFYVSPTPKASDKENVGPKPLPDMFASILGKRKMEPTIEDSTSYVKRRISSSRSLKTTRASVATSVDSTSITNRDPTEMAAGDCVANTPSKKRKTEVFAGVVVPTMKEVMLRRRHSAPLREMADSQPSSRPALNNTTVRMDVVDRKDIDLEASPRKKIRTVRSDEQIAPIVDFPVAGSGKRLCLHKKFAADRTNYWKTDDSILAMDLSATAVRLSSDDDPIKLGRYTPRVLMSPALSARRLNEKRWDEADTGSDDSAEPNSPTKDVIERRERMGWPSAQRAAGGRQGALVL